MSTADAHFPNFPFFFKFSYLFSLEESVILAHPILVSHS